MIGPMEIIVIALVALFLFRADEIGSLLHKAREIRTKYREFKYQITKDVLQPVQKDIEESLKDCTNPNENNSRDS
ncbi:MAG: hypothetical protein N2450_01710 [bacterium]|nr:hypothetical protein [bacterium]